MANSAEEVPVRGAWDAAPWGAMVVRDGLILWMNRRLAAWLGGEPLAFAGLDSAGAEALGLGGLFGANAEWAVQSPEGEIRLHRTCAALPEGGVAYFFEDLGGWRRLERERDHYRDLAQSLETKDAETGVLNTRAILQALENQVGRSRRYGNPLSAIRLSIIPAGDGLEPTVLKNVAQELNAELRWADQIGRLDATSFLAVLPETRLAAAEALAAKLGNERAARASAEGWTLEALATDWRTGDDARKLLRRLIPKLVAH